MRKLKVRQIGSYSQKYLIQDTPQHALDQSNTNLVNDFQANCGELIRDCWSSAQSSTASTVGYYFTKKNWSSQYDLAAKL